MQRRDLSGKRFGRLYVLNRYRTVAKRDRKSTRLNSSHSQISYAVFCLKKKKNTYAQHAQRLPTDHALMHTLPVSSSLESTEAVLISQNAGTSLNMHSTSYARRILTSRP